MSDYDEDLGDYLNSQPPAADTPGVQHQVLEALSQPLLRLQDFMHSGDDNKNLGSLHGQYVKAYDMLGIGSLGNTLHRFALGDQLKHTPDSGDEATMDLLGSLPLATEGLGLAGKGLRGMLEAADASAGSSTLGMFAGPMAKTADKAALETAKVMSASGKPMEEVHAATGWFKGADGAWKQEIDDSISQWNAGKYRRSLRQEDLQKATMYRGAREMQEEAQSRGVPVGSIISEYERAGVQVDDKVKVLAHNAKPEELDRLHQESEAKYRAPIDAKLQDLLQHDDLYAAYPGLKNMDVHFNDLGPYLSGSVDTATGKMKLNSRNGFGSDGHDTVLHEIQHQIQHHEGFDPGDAEGRILEDNYSSARGHAQLEDTVQAAIDIRNGNHLFREINPDAAELADDKTVDIDQLQDYLHTLRQNRPARITPVKAREMYNAAGGEVEARATEKRKTMNRATRKQSYPMESYDTPPDQILLRNQR